MDVLIRSFDIIFQALSVFLVDCEEVEGILLPDLVAHEVGDKKPAQIAK